MQELLLESQELVVVQQEGKQLPQGLALLVLEQLLVVQAQEDTLLLQGLGPQGQEDTPLLQGQEHLVVHLVPEGIQLPLGLLVQGDRQLALVLGI